MHCSQDLGPGGKCVRVKKRETNLQLLSLCDAASCSHCANENSRPSAHEDDKPTAFEKTEMTPSRTDRRTLSAIHFFSFLQAIDRCPWSASEQWMQGSIATRMRRSTNPVARSHAGFCCVVHLTSSLLGTFAAALPPLSIIPRFGTYQRRIRKLVHPFIFRAKLRNYKRSPRRESIFCRSGVGTAR